ncbi:MAG: O-antigen ligase family protein, partial [Actinomycetia bacterium]|nr:O-antigen ligase family protein [Actinomycetes bacterium]
ELQSLKNFVMGSGDSQTIASINTNWRVITWKGFLSEFTEKPVTGWGFGKKLLAEETFDLGWNTGLADNWVSTHNYLISFLYMTGIFGLISFLFIVVYYFIENIRFLKKAESSRDKSIIRGLLSCVFYILILGLFEVVLEIPYQGVFFWVFFSFGIIILKNSGHRFLYNENTSNT